MKREIIPFGLYLQQDKQGFLLNNCDINNIKGFWLDVVADVIESYRSMHNNNLHSVYLRGSVPRGTMIECISDLDSFCLTKSKFVNSMIEGRQEEFEGYFRIQYPKINGVEFDSSVLDEALESYQNRFILKTQSLCVWGDNVIPIIERMTISSKAIGTCIHLENINDVFNSDSERLESEKDISELCSWIFKAALRSAFEIVMLREMRYTRDLYLCWEGYSSYYPNSSKLLKQALVLAIYPESDIEQIKEVWEPLYNQLIVQVKFGEHLLKDTT